MNKIKSHSDYITQTKEPLRASLVKLHSQLKKLLPDADEIINYNLPGFNIGKSTVVGYAAFSKQCGIYLHNDAISENREELLKAGFEPTKTGVKFTPSKPIPEKLLQKLVMSSRSSLGV